MKRRSTQRGAAALFVTVLLCLAMILVVAQSHRNVAVEEDRSANDYRAAAAFEAAEAGLEWMVARINDPTPLSAQCLPSAAPTARSLRDRLLRFDSASGLVVPATWSDDGVATPLQTACVRDAIGWSCSCPTNGRAALPAASGAAMAPAFAVELVASSRAGLVGVVAKGCTRGDADGTCAPTSDRGHQAAARLEARWALLPALRATPVAALTVRGDVDAGASALTVSNADRTSNGLALHAGGRISANALRIGADLGSPSAGSISAGDVGLASMSAAQFFARYFGMDVGTWSRQPAVYRVDCASDCGAAVATAIAAGRRLLYVDGDVALTGPAVFGSSEQPVAIVASGNLRFSGDVALHGVVHGSSLAWDGAGATDALVHGAALVAGHYRGDAPANFVHDGAVLERLRLAAGSFVRINGSWKDF